MKKALPVLLAILLFSVITASFTASAAVPEGTAVKTNTPIAIDGKIDAAWANAKTINVDKVDPVYELAQLNGKVRVMWDKTYIYILAEIPDTLLSASNPDWWMTDCFEFFLCEKGDKKGVSSEIYAEDDVQYGITYKGDIKYVSSRNKYVTTQFRAGNITAATQINRDANGVETGYVVEVRYKPTQMNLAVGSKIGMAFQIDNDNGAGYREGLTYWGEDEEIFAFPAKWGTVTLADAPSSSVPTTPAKDDPTQAPTSPGKTDATLKPVEGTQTQPEVSGESTAEAATTIAAQTTANTPAAVATTTSADKGANNDTGGLGLPAILGIIGGVIVLGGGGAALYFFKFRKKP